MCPGKLLAEQSVWLTVAKSLAVFDISGSPANQEKKGGSRFVGGIVSHPAPYEATIRPRTPGHEALIREVERTHPWGESGARELQSIKV